MVAPSEPFRGRWLHGMRAASLDARDEIVGLDSIGRETCAPYAVSMYCHYRLLSPALDIFLVLDDDRRHG